MDGVCGASGGWVFLIPNFTSDPSYSQFRGGLFRALAACHALNTFVNMLSSNQLMPKARGLSIHPLTNISEKQRPHSSVV